MAPNEHRKGLLVLHFLGVLICALIVGVNQDLASHSGDEVSWSTFWHTVLLALECYAIVAVLLLPWKSRVIPRVPNWLLVLVLGAIVYYFAIHLVDTVTYARKFRYTQPELNLTQYVLSYVSDFLVGVFFVTIMDCILTVPPMVLIHFLGSKLLRMATARRLNATSKSLDRSADSLFLNLIH